MLHSVSRKRRHIKKTTEISISRLFISLGLAAIDTVWALYMDSFGLSKSMIGFISAILIILTLFAGLYSTRILESFREIKVLLVTMMVMVISFLTIALFDNLWVFLIASMIFFIASTIRYNAIGIVFRDEAKDSELNKDQGFMFALLNVGWLLGPIIAGLLMSQYGVQSVFIFSAIFITISATILLIINIRLPRKKRDTYDFKIKENLVDYFRNKRLILPYIMGNGLEIWWAFIYIYVPLFIVNEGDLGPDIVGLFLGLIVIPLIINEYTVGKLSTNLGFKPFFFTGYFILGFAALICFFVSEVWIVLVILGIAGIGVSFIEPIQDTFFFRNVKTIEEEKYYPIYTTSGDVGSFIGRFSIAGVLLFLPYTYAYLTVFVFMITIAFISLMIKEDYIKND